MHCRVSVIFAELAHLVERHLAKVEVASSSLVFRSILLKAVTEYFGQLFLFISDRKDIIPAFFGSVILCCQ